MRCVVSCENWLQSGTNAEKNIVRRFDGLKNGCQHPEQVSQKAQSRRTLRARTVTDFHQRHGYRHLGRQRRPRPENQRCEGAERVAACRRND